MSKRPLILKCSLTIFFICLSFSFHQTAAEEVLEISDSNNFVVPTEQMLQINEILNEDYPFIEVTAYLPMEQLTEEASEVTVWKVTECVFLKNPLQVNRYCQELKGLSSKPQISAKYFSELSRDKIIIPEKAIDSTVASLIENDYPIVLIFITDYELLKTASSLSRDTRCVVLKLATSGPKHSDSSEKCFKPKLSDSETEQVEVNSFFYIETSSK